MMMYKDDKTLVPRRRTKTGPWCWQCTVANANTVPHTPRPYRLGFAASGGPQHKTACGRAVGTKKAFFLLDSVLTACAQHKSLQMPR